MASTDAFKDTTKPPQCPAHTRDPWFARPWRRHEYNPTLRTMMQVTLCLVLGGLVIALGVFAADLIWDRHGGQGFLPKVGRRDSILALKRQDIDAMTPPPDPELEIIALPDEEEEEQGAGEDEFQGPGEMGGEDGVVVEYPGGSGGRQQRPVTICGDHLKGCDKYDQPNICCPVLLACFETTFSPSGIYCCRSADDCAVSEDEPPMCPEGTEACPEDLGGGCCAEGMECRVDGCVAGVNGPGKILAKLLGIRQEDDEDQEEGDQDQDRQHDLKIEKVDPGVVTITQEITSSSPPTESASVPEDPTSPPTKDPAISFKWGEVGLMRIGDGAATTVDPQTRRW